MRPAAKHIPSDTQIIQLLRRWVTLPRDEALGAVVFLSGAVLATLDVVLREPNSTFPAALLRDRLALRVAVACLKLEGRNETESDIRDAMGPAGDMLALWRTQSSVAGSKSLVARRVGGIACKVCCRKTCRSIFQTGWTKLKTGRVHR